MKIHLTALSALVIIIFSPFSVSAQSSGQPNRFADKYALVDGHKLHYQISGIGTSTVVFENGHGDNLNAWNDVFPEVAGFAKVVRYDREGYGLSEPATQPRNFKEIATRLHELLQKENIQPPYILVGHSLGGALIRAFAFLYPNEMAGLVFVDPLNEYIGDEWTKDGIMREISYMDSIVKNGPATYKAEWEIMKFEALYGFPELNSFGTLPDVPMVLFAAGKGRPPGWENSVKKLFAKRMHDLSDARFIEMPQSPHYVQKYEPSLVIENIRRVVFPDAEKILRKTLRDHGVDSCLSEYKKLKFIYPKEYMLERFLNTLGYEQLNAGSVQAAIKLFAMNAERYPESSNVYDSLGEAYMDAGDKKEAIRNYEKSLALNPANTNAERMLKKLK